MNALSWAVTEWQRHIIDPKVGDTSTTAEMNRSRILMYIQDWLGWKSWIKTYPGDGAFAWCGAFAAFCYGNLKPEIRKKWMASTYRLSEYGRTNPRRLVKFDDVLPGDIVTVGGGNYGSHITIAVGWDKAKSMLVTVSGNGGGRLPNGEWGEGVVMTLYPRSELRAAYRPIKEDYI